MTTTQISIQSFLKVAPNLPANIAVLMRGPTGIGKSHLAKQIADTHNLPFIDVRGAAMSEGDVGGYPDIEGMKENGIMTFCMPSWFIRACNEPCVLMLDELNRSLPGVQQSFFQLVLDRELGNDKNGNPYKLHPETRVIAAINFGAEYDVNEMDPAFLRRFWVCDILPTSEDWVIWAENNGVDPVIVEYIRKNPMELRVDPTEVEPGTVCPNPASWDRANQCLKHMGMSPSKFAGKPNPDGMYTVLLGLLGTETAIHFCKFVQDFEISLSVEDILEGRIDELCIKTVSQSSILDIINKLEFHGKDNDWTIAQVDNIDKFARLCSKEQFVLVWNAVTRTHNVKNIGKLHKSMGKEVVEIVKAAQKVASN